MSVSHETDESHDHAHAFDKIEALRIIFVAICAIAVWFKLWEQFDKLSIIGTLGLIVGGWPIFKEALENSLAKRMTMELSMTIAIIAAAAISQFFTALVITLFVLIAEVLEGMTVSRGRQAIHDLLNFLPRIVVVRRNGSIQEMDTNILKVGDVIIVSPGGRIPVDGIVIKGHSFVDQSRITGESMPVEKIADSTVFAGSINQSGALEIATQQIGRDTSYGKIIEAVEQAEHSRAPVQRLADRLAGYLVYFALVAALFTFLLTRDITSTISVIIVAGACGIAAGTPLAILGAIGRSARLGAIIKGGVYLEALGHVKTVVLDKTGTLTFGQPEVQAIIPCQGILPEIIIDAAASAELYSEHPLGKSIVTYAQKLGRKIAEPTSFHYTPGFGINAISNEKNIMVGNLKLLRDKHITVPDTMHESLKNYDEASEVFIVVEKKLIGAIVIADTIRPEAKVAMQTITNMGIKTILLTGDTKAVAEKVAYYLGIHHVEANLLPENKLAYIKQLVAKGEIVAMVGDGINDAPALMAANVGIAMGSGTDVARESANIVLLGNDLMKFAETVKVARWTRRIIWQNFTGTLAVDTIGIALAACGLLNPLLAAFIHVASELTFILNSTRLLPRREKS